MLWGFHTVLVYIVTVAEGGREIGLLLEVRRKVGRDCGKRHPFSTAHDHKTRVSLVLYAVFLRLWFARLFPLRLY